MFIFDQVSSDGLFMFCGFGQKVKVMELETGKMRCAIGQVNLMMMSLMMMIIMSVCGALQASMGRPCSSLSLT